MAELITMSAHISSMSMFTVHTRTKILKYIDSIIFKIIFKQEIVNAVIAFFRGHKFTYFTKRGLFINFVYSIHLAPIRFPVLYCDGNHNNIYLQDRCVCRMCRFQKEDRLFGACPKTYPLCFYSSNTGCKLCHPESGRQHKYNSDQL